MTTTWFTILALMLTAYVVMDGFDFGAGILHLFVAKTDEERRTVLAAIGPVWDGNEVWLIASGGILIYAFPRAYAAAFSGYYLALMMVLWLLILRGLAIDFRSHEKNALWRSFWDGILGFSSTLMAIILGVALGTVIRGVPLDESGYFSGPLFSDFRISAHPGILDWYTVLVGLFALCVLAGHGALYLFYKTTGPVQERCRALAVKLWAAIVALGTIVTAATAQVRPQLYMRLFQHPLGWLLALVIAGSLISVFLNVKKQREISSFLSSVGFIIGMLGATAVGLYPWLLFSTLDPAYSLSVDNASAGSVGLRVGLIWWPIAMVLAVGYFVYLFRSFRGKVKLTSENHYP